MIKKATQSGGGGTITVGTFGSSPNADGASASGSTITLQPADATHPGLLTTGAQSIAGAKTFTGAISASNLSGTNTGDQTSVTGNAGTATALQNARTINGVSFNGTANVVNTTADIADSANKRYVTDAQLTVIGNTSGTNTGDEGGNVGESVPATPASGITFYSQRQARNQAWFKDPQGQTGRLSPFVGGLAWSKAIGGGVSTNIAVACANTITGTAGGASWANTSLLTKANRCTATSAASAGSSSSVRLASPGWYIESGFHTGMKFGFSTITATFRWFAGVKSANFANADPSSSSNVNIIGDCK